MSTNLSQRLQSRVRHLAEHIGERHFRKPEALVATYRYLVGELQALGVLVQEHEFRVEGMKFINLEVVAPRRSASTKHEDIVIGAHYDTVLGTPGADDNASGVAALLELVEALGKERFERTLRFVFFPNEEPPFYPDQGMGSDAYARHLKASGVRVHMMLSLEMLGYYDSTPGAQKYPPGMGWVYPKRGDFIGFVSDVGSRQCMHEFKAAFRATSQFPCESLAAPRWTVIVGLSDHRSFWKHGYPAFMVTDTAFMRNPHYHLPSDTPDRLDYERFANVTLGIEAALRRLAGS